MGKDKKIKARGIWTIWIFWTYRKIQNLNGKRWAKMKIQDVSNKISEFYKKIWKRNVLFVCDSAVNRSPTFAEHFSDLDNTRARGTHAYNPDLQLNTDDLKWAGTVYCMDLSQARYIYLYHTKYYRKVTVLGISDSYTYNEPALIELVNFRKDWEFYGEKTAKSLIILYATLMFSSLYIALNYGIIWFLIELIVFALTFVFIFLKNEKDKERKIKNMRC